MAEPVLELRPKKYKGESCIVSLRISKEMLQAVDFAAESCGRTRNEILTKSIEFALDHMQIKTDKE